MKITYISDLHLEWCEGNYDSNLEMFCGHGSDLVILAGDIAVGSMLRDVISKFCTSSKNVMFVSGNHDCYGGTISDLRALMQELETQFDNFDFLDRKVVEIEGQRFVGCTMWFPEDPLNVTKENMLTDFRLISNFREDVYKENIADVSFLKENVKEGDIVVTHHLPSYASVASVFKNSELNCFFVCPMEDLILDEKPSYWIHGHTHYGVDYILGDTRIVCNPCGYANKAKKCENPPFIQINNIA